MKFQESRLLELLKKEPNIEENPEEHEKWNIEIAKEINELLGLFENDQFESVRESLEELSNEIKELKKHKHLPTGEAAREL